MKNSVRFYTAPVWWDEGDAITSIGMFSNHDLMVLLAVADIGSVRGAANAMGRTQPAVTQAIRRLEEASGLNLLDRASYRARLTDHGERFVERARTIIGHTKGLHDLASLLGSGVEPRLRVALDCAIPTVVWATLLARFAAAFPQTEIEVEEGEGYMIRPRLASGEFDLAILFDQAVHQNVVQLEALRIGATDFSNVVHRDKVDHLRKEGALIPQILVVDFKEPLMVHGLIEGQHYWRVATHAMQAELIRRGLGWGTVPCDLVDGEIADGTLVALAYLGLNERSTQPFSLYRRQNVLAGPAASYLWDTAKQEFADA